MKTPTCISSASFVRRAFWATEEFSDILNFSYTDDPDLVVINGPGASRVGLFDCRRGRFRWKKRLMIWSGVTYHPRSRRILGFAKKSFDAQGALVELDLATGRVVRELTQTADGPILAAQNPRYLTSYALGKPFSVYGTAIDDDPDLVLLPDGGRHTAGLLSLRTGRYRWKFGRDGKPGSGLDALHDPRDLVWTLAGGAWIADYANHRLLNLRNVDSKPEVAAQWIFPRPMSVAFTYSTPGSGFFSANAAVSTECFYQPLTLVLSDFDDIGLDRYTSLLGWVPIASNQVAFNPWDPSLLQVNQWNSVFEVDWAEASRGWAAMARFAKPYAVRQPVGPSGWASEPIVGLPHPRMLLKIHTNKPARAVIEIPQPALRLLAVPADFRWIPADEFALPAGRVTLRPVDPPPAVFRLRIKARQAASVNVSVEGY